MRDQAEYHHERQAEAREAGRCIWCGRAARGHALCAKHLRQQRERSAERKAAGLCPRCGSEDYDGASWACDRCRQLDTERKAALVEEGLCRACGGPNDSGLQTCEACRERYNAARRARRARCRSMRSEGNPPKTCAPLPRSTRRKGLNSGPMHAPEG